MDDRMGSQISKVVLMNVPGFGLSQAINPSYAAGQTKIV